MWATEREVTTELGEDREREREIEGVFVQCFNRGERVF